MSYPRGRLRLPEGLDRAKTPIGVPVSEAVRICLTLGAGAVPPDVRRILLVGWRLTHVLVATARFTCRTAVCQSGQRRLPVHKLHGDGSLAQSVV